MSILLMLPFAMERVSDSMNIVMSIGDMESFVMMRLGEMGERPLMWAGSQEAFALQLVLLAEITGVTPREAMKTLYKGPVVDCRKDLDEEWAKEAVTKITSLIKERAAKIQQAQI
jgi:hypothetical protein